MTELFDILLAQANPGQGSYVLHLFPGKLRNDLVCDECSSSFAGEGIIAWAYEAYNAAKPAGLTISGEANSIHYCNAATTWCYALFT